MRSPFALFRAVLCLSTAAMMVVSWPLWVSGGLFPKVPFVGGVRLLPVWASWVRLAATGFAMAAASAGFWPRRSLGITLVLSAWMVLEDQFRLQPWMYQFLLMGLAMAVCPEGQAMSLGRLFVIALYFHSALSKLDGSFVHGLGATFLRTALDFLHVRIAGKARVAAILAMPTWELLVAFGLIFRRTRKPAWIGAVLLHVALLILLGPAGLGHSLNVLIWNAAMAVEVVLLFRQVEIGPEEPRRPTLAAAASLTRLVFVLAAVLPFGERAGWWDTWPSFALYSSRDERADFLAIPGETDIYPEAIRRHFHNVGTYDLLYFNEWSLVERRAPAYPQGRALNGVAEALAARYRGPRPAHLIQVGRAERSTGRRSRVERFGLDAIRQHGDTYWINAHPAP